MTVIVLDTNGTDGAMTIDTNAPDQRSLMLASAASLVATTLDMEGKLADTAKAWGASVFMLAFPASADDKAVDLNTLIGDSKMAAGWATITGTEAGKKAKARMEVYFSNARLVAESFDSLSDDDKRDIRNGLSSVHYRAGLIRKAASDAKKAATKEAARIAAEDAAALAKAEADAAKVDATNPAPEADAGETVETLAVTLGKVQAMIANASDDDLTGAYDAFAALVAAYDARINAALEAAPIATAA